jgi:serine/threonine protein kinase
VPDFGARWQIADPKPIGKGGQSHAYLVRDAYGSTDDRYVAKVLNGVDDPARRQRLETEIERCREFDHPNVVRLVDAGHTVKSNYPFLVLPYYEHRSLEEFRVELHDDPIEILTLFAKICDGVAHVHTKNVIHRDIKPANIFVSAERQPVVGDFGISYRDAEDRLTREMEVVAPRWFGAPELRNGYLENPTRSADVYSLGKLLYWLFTGKVYDREEQDYGQRKLAGVLDATVPGYSFADQLVEATVRYNPGERKIAEAEDFASATRQTTERIKAGGRVLDLRVPKRCMFCGLGFYRAAHDYVPITSGLRPAEKWPGVEKRRNPPQADAPPFNPPDIYGTAREVANLIIGHRKGIPLLLVCDYCGNVQYFRLDLAPDGHGKFWQP